MKFKDLGIKPESKGLIGDKIKIERVLNREIEVVDYRIEKSKYEAKGNGRCLYLQIKLNDNNHVVFTGSGVLMNMIDQVLKEHFPFTTTIVKENERFEFT